MRRFVFLAAMAAVPFSVPTQASALDVMRCNTKTPSGVYLPILRVVTQNNMLDIKIGEHGLSRETYYDDRAVKAFLVQKTNLKKRQLTAKVSSTCGAAQDIQEIAAVQTTIAQEPPEEEYFEEEVREVEDREFLDERLSISGIVR